MNKTARQAYIEILIELVKEESPVLYLEDFVYYYNKAISEYMKFRYEKFEVTQQLTDDLRAWKKVYTTNSLVTDIDSIGKIVTIDGDKVLVDTYRHLLNCIVGVDTVRPSKQCSDSKSGAAPNTSGSYKVTRMTSDLKAELLNNEYLKPAFYRPYFDILDNKITIDMGSSNTNIKSSTIHIEYLKQPELVILEEDDIRVIDEEDPDYDPNYTDESQVLEFPQDVYEEINKIALKLILEREMNPRLQSHLAVNQSINDLSMGGGGK